MPVGIRPLVCCCSCEVSWFSRVCCQLLRHLLSSISISAIKCSRCRSSHPNFRRRAMGSHGNGKTQMMSYSEFKQFANTINVDRTRVEQLWLLWGKLSFVRQPLVESHLTLYRLYRISRCFRRVLRVACVGCVIPLSDAPRLAAMKSDAVEKDLKGGDTRVKVVMPNAYKQLQIF